MKDREKRRKLQRSITSRRARSMQSLELNSFLKRLTRRASNVPDDSHTRSRGS